MNLKFNEIELKRLYEASALMYRVFFEYNSADCTNESIEIFKRLTSPESFRKFLESRNEVKKFFNMWVCIDEENDEIVGVLAAYYDTLDNLFVDKRYHRHGIAKRLFEMMLKYFNPAKIDVSASLYAAPFYRKLGFIGDDEQIINKGMKVIMMTYHHEGGENSEYLELSLLLDKVREKHGEEKMKVILKEAMKELNKKD